MIMLIGMGLVSLFIGIEEILKVRDKENFGAQDANRYNFGIFGIFLAFACFLSILAL